MARTGLLKSDVKKARDILVAQNINPSVDAVRISLGNTGSKTTIHKYLKELNEEGGSTPGIRPSISEVLQDIVSRLAMQLQDEADARIEEIRVLDNEKSRLHVAALFELQTTIAALTSKVSQLDADITQERASKSLAEELLQKETLTRHTANQQVIDLKERLTENEAHRQSLEEKHIHAREALEHYRQSVKEQRDQDQRRHEQQVQQLQAEMRKLQQGLVIKQDEVTRLNQDGTRLVADLSHAHKDLYEQQNITRQLEKKLESLQSVQQQQKILEAELSEKEERILDHKREMADALTQITSLTKDVHRLELEIAKSDATIAAQESANLQLQAYLERRGALPLTSEPST